MIRRATAGVARDQMIMSREEILRSVGVVLNGNTGGIAHANALTDQLADSVFSGYGSFRPITVRSYSIPDNANLERSQ